MSEALSSDQAFGVQTEVVQHVRGRRNTWVALAASLASFHAGKGWEALDMDSFSEWLGQPEISLSRGEAYAMIGAWRELVEKRGVDSAELTRLDVSKVAVVLSAIKERRVSVEQALSDCEALSRSDLRAEYQDSTAAEYRVCESCGQRVRLSKASQTGAAA